MTEEEWIKANSDAWEESEELDRQELALAEKLAAEQPPVERPAEKVGYKPRREPIRFLQANNMLDSVKLNDKFLQRLEDMDKPKAPPERPPWEQVDMEEQQTYYNSALARQLSRKNAYGATAAGT